MTNRRTLWYILQPGGARLIPERPNLRTGRPAVSMRSVRRRKMGFGEGIAGLGNPAITNSLIGFGRGLGTPAVDRFGLPLTWSILGETDEQRQQRLRALMALVDEVFCVAIRHCGDDGARYVWKAASKGKRGRPKGQRMNPDADATLLIAYDGFVTDCDETHRKALPRRLAALLKRHRPTDYPATVEFIEKRIRRLLKDREAKRKAERDALVAALMRQRRPRSMLSGEFFEGAINPISEQNALRALSRGTASTSPGHKIGVILSGGQKNC